MRLKSRSVVGAMIIAILSVFFFTVVQLPVYADSENKTCLSCHSNEGLSKVVDGQKYSLYVDEKVFEGSVHSQLNCTMCHQEISGVPHDSSKLLYGSDFKRAVNQRCETCHPQEAKEYRESDHSKSPYCTDCHGSHNIKGKDDPSSPIYRTNVPATCGRCHQGTILETYNESFHGSAVKLGSAKSPTCVTCHGAHNIKGIEDPGSPISKENVPKTCAKCHPSPETNFATQPMHLEVVSTGPGAPVYWVEKFFTWLTILTLTALVVHIEVELYGEYRRRDQESEDDIKDGERHV